ncbi:Trk system potassium transporter TrkA [Alysiella filiformis]|uniref:Trk system potassium uptake protein TrkA n=1 Tax=Alysiella filiformis DSM 16848 TaxID=1120981 RepID=A0A286EE38_9NEIS|nr:Trk system potassium transporter TrkA [Alysiella filiformis]QMT30938.1 Trk system potassium transporter TrkA [Alysiella filiformis]UBQ56074.1 Trk system potassium transporter TrkA [Alysiella filiformis DSM 16848]SOD69176.1 trk system potassium uptake protein TrkA [Alysiella filiformis DSM 16848]
MKILILGSGQVGSTIAQELANMPNNDVTIIDTDENALRNIGSQLDVQTLVGNGASPLLLEQAGANDTDMLLALTRSDETNLVACKLAASLFNIPNRIARVRASAYLEYGEQHKSDDEETHLSDSLHAFDVTDSIHPEQLVTEHLVGLLSYVRALQVLPFAHEQVKMVVAQAKHGDMVAGKSIIEINETLPEHTDCQICAIYRNNHLIVPQPNTVIVEGDEICFVLASEHMQAVMNVMFRYDSRNRRVMIAGGGNIGYRLAKRLENQFNIKIIESNATRAEWLAENLDNALVLQGSASDENLLAREYIDEIDVFCALTNDDENNIMSALLAKNLGAKRVISIINRSRYVDLLTGNQIDIIVSPHQITIGSVLAHVRRGDVAAVYPLRRGAAEAIEVVVHGDKRTSSLVGRRVSEVDFPKGCHIAAIVRGDEVVMGRNHEVELADGDHLIFFVARRRVLRELEKLIQVKMGFFG